MTSIKGGHCCGDGSRHGIAGRWRWRLASLGLRPRAGRSATRLGLLAFAPPRRDRPRLQAQGHDPPRRSSASTFHDRATARRKPRPSAHPRQHRHQQIRRRPDSGGPVSARSTIAGMDWHVQHQFRPWGIRRARSWHFAPTRGHLVQQLLISAHQSADRDETAYCAAKFAVGGLFRNRCVMDLQGAGKPQSSVGVIQAAVAPTMRAIPHRRRRERQCFRAQTYRAL